MRLVDEAHKVTNSFLVNQTRTATASLIEIKLSLFMINLGHRRATFLHFM